MNYYNLAIDLKGQKCVVVGGGKVAFRKVRKLCASGAEVIAIAPHFLTDFYEVETFSNLTLITEEYKKEVLTNAVLVFAATSSPTVNQQVCKDAKEQKIRSNSVNGVEHSSFIIPATCHKDILTIGILTEGKAPVLSKHLRQYLQDELGKIPKEYIEELVTLRRLKVAEEDKAKRAYLEKEIDTKTEKIIRLLKQK